MRDYPMAEAQTACGSNMLDAKRHVSPTLAQNIEQRIAVMEEQIVRLRSVKEKLAAGQMLDIPLDDLRFAMNY